MCALCFFQLGFQPDFFAAQLNFSNCIFRKNRANDTCNGNIITAAPSGDFRQVVTDFIAADFCTVFCKDNENIAIQTEDVAELASNTEESEPTKCDNNANLEEEQKCPTII